MKNQKFNYRISALIDPIDYTCFRAEGTVIGQGNNQDECNNNATELLYQKYATMGKLSIDRLEPTATDVEEEETITKLQEWTSNNKTDDQYIPDSIFTTQGTTITTKEVTLQEELLDLTNTKAKVEGETLCL